MGSIAPQCFPERNMLTYHFGDEPKLVELKAEGFTCMVEFDDGIVQSEKANFRTSTRPGRTAGFSAT